MTSNARVTLTDLASRLVKSGGFTVRRNRVEHAGGDVVVSVHRPAEAVVRLSDLRLLRFGGDAVHNRFAFASLEQAIGWWRGFTATAPTVATHIGGWVAYVEGHGRCLYLDRTRVCETRDEALAIARRLGERAVFDLDTFDEVAA